MIYFWHQGDVAEFEMLPNQEMWLFLVTFSQGSLKVIRTFSFIFLILFQKKLFIYLVVLSLSCSMWDLVPWPEIEPRPRALEAWSLSYWTTREVPSYLIDVLYLPHILAYFLTTRLKISHIRKQFSTNCCSYQ